MGHALAIARVGVACVFFLAGVAKLADLAGSRRAVVDFGVSERFAGVVAWLLPVGELAVAVGLVVGVSARFGAAGAVVLLAGFVAAIGNALAHGQAPDCHCFGQVHSSPAGWGTLLRNLALMGVAGFVVIGGWTHPGDSATRWLTRVPASWLVGVAAGVVIVGLIAFQVWFSLQLLSQNGRTIGRLEAVEEAIAALTEGSGPVRADARPAVLGAGLSGGGLPVGMPAPDFWVQSVDGERYTLVSLLSGGRPLMLLFSDAGCGSCDALMPEVAEWQRVHLDRLRIAVVASGDERRNRVKAEEHAIVRMLLQSERELSEAYQASGTPMAVVIGPGGLVQSPTVGGADAIRTLVQQATRPVLAVRHLPAQDANGSQSPDGNGNGNAIPASAADGSRVGEPAPELVLSDLDGQRVALIDLYQRRTVAIFWNPGCGFCQQMLSDLKVLEANPPPGAPQIVVITSGDPDRARKDELRSRVLVDSESEAMSAFGAGGTPMGVLVEDGRIASRVAAGADAVLALIHAGTLPAEPAHHAPART